MKISRRWFMAGLALTGAAVPAAYFGHREWTKPDPTITPGEASFDVADMAGQRLANALRGVWDIRFEGTDAGLEGLPLSGEGRLRLEGRRLSEVRLALRVAGNTVDANGALGAAAGITRDGAVGQADDQRDDRR